MYDRQASLIDRAKWAVAALEGRTAAASLWKYTCPVTGEDFWTSKKQTSIRSPFTGKTFTAKPDKDSLSDVGKEIKKDQAEAKEKKAASNLWKYTCPVTGEDFWTSKKQTTIRSPFTGKTFTAKPDKDLLSDVGKEIKKDQAEAKEKKAASNLWKYTCPETNEDFWTSKKQTTIRSPFTGKTFTAKPDKDTLSDVGKEIKKDQADAKAKKASKDPESGKEYLSTIYDVRDLNDLVDKLEYSDLEYFFSYNPGAVQAVATWVGEQRSFVKTLDTYFVEEEE